MDNASVSSQDALMRVRGDSAGKQRLRESLLRARKDLDPGELASAEAALAGRLGLLLEPDVPSVIAAYVPVGREPGGSLLPDRLAAAAPASMLLLPVLRDDLDLDWARFRGPRSLRTGGRGLREPVGPCLGVDAVTRARLVVVPALAVDRSGMRLGRGGGSYDRALARVSPDAVVVALLHDDELVDRVPAEPHDRRVDAVLTPTRYVWFGRAAGSGVD